MEFVTLQHGITLQYFCEGKPTGSPLVFINSLGTDLRIWDQVVPHFAERYHIIRYDKRGHGLSDCPPAPYSIRDHATDLANLLDYLEVAQAILVGISVGLTYVITTGIHEGYFDNLTGNIFNVKSFWAKTFPPTFSIYVIAAVVTIFNVINYDAMSGRDSDLSPSQ